MPLPRALEPFGPGRYRVLALPLRLHVPGQEDGPAPGRSRRRPRDP